MSCARQSPRLVLGTGAKEGTALTGIYSFRREGGRATVALWKLSLGDGPLLAVVLSSYRTGLHNVHTPHAQLSQRSTFFGLDCCLLRLVFV